MPSRRSVSALIGMCCVSMSFANTDARAEQRRPAVLIDSWWSGDYARMGCEQARSFFDQDTESRIRNFGCGAVPQCPEAMARSAACISAGEPKSQAEQFEDLLMIEFANNPACKGATVARYHGPDRPSSAAEQAVMSGPHWDLIIDFVVGSPAQPWMLLYNGEADARQAAPATAARMASEVCAIVGARPY